MGHLLSKWQMSIDFIRYPGLWHHFVRNLVDLEFIYFKANKINFPVYIELPSPGFQTGLWGVGRLQYPPQDMLKAVKLKRK